MKFLNPYDMKKLILSLSLALLYSLFLYADSTVDTVLSELEKYRMEFTYRYTVTGMQDITVEGKATVQKGCFRMEGAGLLILCDSVDIWTLDLDGKEAYVESSGPFDYSDYLLSLEWEGENLKGTFAEPTSGAIVPFEVFDIKKSPASGDLSMFSLPQDFFNDGADWIITDLR